jgi:hypothetical protein
MAEVLHCIEVGFLSSEIILTGPGKFWMGGKTGDIDCGKLRCIFADSIPDLQDILKKWPTHRTG